MAEQNQQSKRNVFARFILVITNLYVLVFVIYLILRVILPPDTWWMGFFNNFAPFYFLPLLIFLPMMMFMRATASAVRIFLLLLIGAFWFGGLFIPPTRVIASESDISIKLTTFNIHADDRPFENILLWIEEQDADIIALQEVRSDLPLPDNAVELDMGESRWGSALITDYEVVEAEYIALTTNQARNIRAVLNIGNREIVVYAVHLTLPNRAEPRVQLPGSMGLMFSLLTRYDETTRNQQIDDLLAMLEEETLPYIVLGDFNTSEFSAKYADLANSMHDSYREANIGFGMTFRATVPIVRIDYIWHDDNFKTVSAQVGSDGSSDHLPVHATLSTTSLADE